VTNSGDDLRTGWYPDQPSLTPELVGGDTFGEQWSANVTGQVYAQPLLANGTLLVATEANRAYGLDPATGATRWQRPLGTPWNPNDLGCGDLAPEIGVTATPVVDQATNTAYLTSKTYAAGSEGPARWYLHALDMTTGEERPGFPVLLSGSADNAPGQTFHPTTELQRPGLLLMDGVVYAAFGSHCDVPPWQGWVFGVSTGGEVTARWVAVASGDGAGIWQSGAGLMSDGPGRIFVGTGNPGAPPKPTAGTSPPGNLGESIVRLRVQPDGTLAAADFFAPFDAAELDTWDADFASGGPVGLPDRWFGTPAVPHVAVAVGKQGYVYLLDRDDLGGIGTGPNGSDAVVQRVGPSGGVWARPGVWPGDGGYVYVPTASGGNSGSSSSGFLHVYRYGTSPAGRPTLSLVATSADSFGFSSSSPVITSDGTTSGSALVWVVWTGGGSGQGAQLRAYDPVPAGGVPVLRWSAPIGTSAKFAMPGVGAGRIFVGTRDGKVRAFGSPVTPPVSAGQLAFGVTTVGQSSTRTLTLTANDAVTVESIDSSSGRYTVGTPSAPLPATLAAGAKLSVPVHFAPSASGPTGATLTVHTSRGDVHVGASGTGQAAGPELGVAPPAVSFGGIAVGAHASGTVTLRNTGAQPLTISEVRLPEAPFHAADVPAAGSQIPSGGNVSVTVSFDPTTVGDHTGAIGFDTSGGNAEVGLSGTAGTPGHLVLSSEAVGFGPVPYGQSAERTFTVTNAGETPVSITRSKPPSGGAFAATTPLSEGTVIDPGQTVSATVRFEPSRIGGQTGGWQINGNDGSGLHTVAFTGTGAVPWTLNGSATAAASEVVLTRAAAYQAGTAFWPRRIDPRALTVDFDMTLGGGSGGDGLAFVLGDAMRGAQPTSLGATGGSLAFIGATGPPGLAVAFDTFRNGSDPSTGFVGITDGATTAPGVMHWLATAPAALRGAARHVRIATAGGVLTVHVDGTRVLQRAVTLPPAAYLGFGAGTGDATDRQAISNLQVDGAAAPPAATLVLSSTVVAPAGSHQSRERVSWSGTCPSAFAAGPVSSGDTAAPAAGGARAADTCSLTQTVPAGPGWTVSASVNGGPAVRLAPQGAVAAVPAFPLAEGANTVAFTTTWHTLVAAPASLAFHAVAGRPAPSPAPLDLSTNRGAAEVAAATDASWLHATGAGPTPRELSVSVDASGLAPGTYTGRVALSAPGYAPASVPVTLTVTSPPLAPSAPDGPPAGLVGWWSFSERAGRLAHDGSGLGNTGTVFGARRTAAGHSGPGLRLGGRRDRVEIARSPSLLLTRALTLEAWVRPDRTRPGWRSVLVGGRAGSPAYGLYSSSDTTVPAARAAATAERTGRGGRPLPARRWTHLAATWDGSVLRLYVDGVRRGARRLTGRLAGSARGLRIGGGLGGRWFTGTLDDVRVYNRALSAAELVADMRR
jgi:hypothetical protein